ncbi:hypothetical protein pb186bvf_014159 [Paramecium bursaria]
MINYFEGTKLYKTKKISEKILSQSMSQIFTKLVYNQYYYCQFRSTSTNEDPVSQKDKCIPKDFAQQILNNDIIFVLSNYTNRDAMKNLVQLYMMGVEHYKEMKDMAYQYFQIKLHHIMDNVPAIEQEKKIIQQQPELNKTATPKQKKKPDIPKLDTKIEITPKPFVSMRPIKDVENKLFTYQDQAQPDKQKVSQNLTQQSEERQETEPDERKENMTLQVKQEVFIMDEQKEAKNIITQFNQIKDKMDNLILDNISAQANEVERRRAERQRTFSSLSSMKKATSETKFEKLLVKTPHKEFNRVRNQSQYILEDPNEQLSSKLPSSSKNQEVNQFQFEQNDDSK